MMGLLDEFLTDLKKEPEPEKKEPEKGKKGMFDDAYSPAFRDLCNGKTPPSEG